MVAGSLVLNEEVVLMEDSKVTQQHVKDVLEKELSWKVKVVESKEDAITFAGNERIPFFILDIHMGEFREQEGLDALEEIKKINPNTFVCVFSAKKSNQKLAERLKVDFFLEKTSDLDRNIRELASVFLNHQLKYLDFLEKEKKEQIEKMINSDPNLFAYEALIDTPEWLDRFEDKFVAFVDGRLVDNDKSRKRLLERVQSQYAAKPRFVRKATKSESMSVVDIPYYEIV